MGRLGKTWCLAPATDAAADLARELAVAPVVAQVLVNRGIDDAAAARLFLRSGAEALADPFLMKGMAAAVDRIGGAIAAGEKITVYGDYDVDGITATALLYRVLTRLGGAVDYYIPERQSEGYGLNAAALETICRAGCGLVVTVDCGIASASEVAALSGRMDIVVTDHHQPPELLPPALAVLNPKQDGCSYPEKNLAGVGVAFKLCQALWQRLKGDSAPLADYLDLVAVGTVADIVPLTGENRAIVKLGLDRLAVTDNLGFKALMQAASLAADKLDTGKVGFVIAPRLNAAGRLSHASAGVELLLTDDSGRAAELAAGLDEENSRRQAVEKELLAAAEAELAGTDPEAQKVLVLAGEGWHPGVIGIVASRLLDRYYRPVVMISVRDGVGKGSCRSIPGFDIYRALEQCGDLLTQFGGHQFAAGLTIDAANIARLRERLSAIAAETLTAEDYRPVLNIDGRMALAEIDAALLEQLACLAPYGPGNPQPVFVSEKLAVTGVRPIGQEGRHLKLRVRRGRACGDVIGWNMGELAKCLTGDASIDLAFVPEFNDWQGRRNIQLKAHDVHVHTPVPDHVRLEDARTVAKDAYLDRVLAGAAKTLIVVNDRREALRLAARLKRSRPPARAVGCWYPELSACRRRRRQADFAAGRVAVLVAAGTYPGEADAITDIVLYSLPLTQEALTGYCRLAAARTGPVTLHFAYGAADGRTAAAMLDDIFPDRRLAGWFYLTLKEAAGPDGGVSQPPRALARTVARRSGRTVDPAGLEACLTIFAELGLVRRDADKVHHLSLLPAPPEKLALEQSAAFRAGAAAKQGHAALGERLIRSPLAELWKMSLDGE